MTIPAVDRAVTILRALIAEDWDQFERLHAAQRPEDRQAFAVVLGVTVVKAVTERFGASPEDRDIIDFVADARVRLVGPGALVPEDAERVIRSALGQGDLISDMDGKALGSAQTSLLFSLAHENEAAGDTAAKALAEGASEAASFLSQQGQQ